MSEPLEERLREGLRKAAAFEPRTAQARARFERLSQRRRARARIRTASLAAVGATLMLALVGGVGFTKDLRDRLGLGEASTDWNVGIISGDEANEEPEQRDSAGKAEQDPLTEEEMSAVDSKPSGPQTSTDGKGGGGSTRDGNTGTGDTATGGESGSKGTAGANGQDASGAEGDTAESGTGGDACVAKSGDSDPGQGTTQPSGEGGAAGETDTGAAPAPSPSPSTGQTC